MYTYLTICKENNGFNLQGHYIVNFNFPWPSFYSHFGYTIVFNIQGCD